MGKLFYEEATSELIQKYNDEATALVEEIKNSPTNVEVTGTKYYVSSSEGDDNNDGLSPESAWKSVQKVNDTTFEKGVGIFFKRGDEWRIKDPLNVRSGMTISAYGEGKKPRFIGSVDASGADKWEKTEYENIWKYTEKIGGFEYNVGAIIFDGGRAWGIHVSPMDDGCRVDNGTVYNGFETYTIERGPFAGAKDLQGNLEFYHEIDRDPSVDTLYLYCREGNPGEVFKSIELVDRGELINILDGDPQDWNKNTSTDIMIDNMDMYAACFGVGSHNVKNVTVQYCTFRWMGGSIQGINMFGRNFSTRYGNAIESFGYADGFIMRYNYATQVYDCCWTAQHTGAVRFNNVQMYKNVADFANTGPEVWIGSGGSVTNLQIHDNYNRYMGYGFSHQRPAIESPHDKKGSGWIGAGGIFYGEYVTHLAPGSEFYGNDVYNNVNMFADSGLSQARFVHPKTYNFHDNICILEEGKRFGKWAPYDVRDNVCIPEDAKKPEIIDGEEYPPSRMYMYNKEDLEELAKYGIELGTKFYYTKPGSQGNLFELSLPDSGYIL